MSTRQLRFEAVLDVPGSGLGAPPVVSWRVHAIDDETTSAPWPVTLLSGLGPVAVQAAAYYGGDLARATRTLLTSEGQLVADLLAGHGVAADSVLLFERAPTAAGLLCADVLRVVQAVLRPGPGVVAAYPEHVDHQQPASLRPWRDAGFRAYQDGLWIIPAPSMR